MLQATFWGVPCLCSNNHTSGVRRCQELLTVVPRTIILWSIWFEWVLPADRIKTTL